MYFCLPGSLQAENRRMTLLQRVGQLISNDLGALLPGTGVPLDRTALVRLLLYLFLFLFAVRLFMPVLTSSVSAPIPGQQPDYQTPAREPARVLDEQDI